MITGKKKNKYGYCVYGVAIQFHNNYNNNNALCRSYLTEGYPTSQNKQLVQAITRIKKIQCQFTETHDFFINMRIIN